MCEEKCKMLKLTVISYLVCLSWFGLNMVGAARLKQRYPNPRRLVTFLEGYYLNIKDCDAYFTLKCGNSDKYSQISIKEVKGMKSQSRIKKNVTISSRISNHFLCVDEDENRIVPLWFLNEDDASQNKKCIFEQTIRPYKHKKLKNSYYLTFAPLFYKLKRGGYKYLLARKKSIGKITCNTKFPILHPREFRRWISLADIGFLDKM